MFTNWFSLASRVAGDTKDDDITALFLNFKSILIAGVSSFDILNRCPRAAVTLSPALEPVLEYALEPTLELEPAIASCCVFFLSSLCCVSTKKY